MRAVFDPNILISGLLSPRGAPAALLRAWLGGDFELVVSDRLLDELERALGYRKIRARVDDSDAAEFVALLRTAAVHAADPSVVPKRSRDPGDDYLLALAESERAYLVTGDADLHVLAAQFPILSANRFAELIGD